MVRDYELMYIVRPDLDDEGLRTATESVGALVRGLGGEISKTSIWGRRRLAYEIDHLRDGHYVLAQVRLDGSRVTELERALAIHDTVFRHLLVRREPAAEAAEGAEDAEDAEAATSAEGEPEEGAPEPEPAARAQEPSPPAVGEDAELAAAAMPADAGASEAGSGGEEE